MSSAGSFLTGLAGGVSSGEQLKERRKDRELEAARVDAMKASVDSGLTRMERGVMDAHGGVVGSGGGTAGGASGTPYQPSGDEALMLARTLQAEAGNQGKQGMIDVGSVIMNRVGDKRYSDGTLKGAIMKPGQFSAWNSVTEYAGGEQGQDMNFQPNEEALQAAQELLAGSYQDQTGGATHYVNKNISQPSWGKNVTYKRGDHWFGQADGPGVKPRKASAPATQEKTKPAAKTTTPKAKGVGFSRGVIPNGGTAQEVLKRLGVEGAE